MKMEATKLKVEFWRNPTHRGVFFLEEASAKGQAFLSAKQSDIKIFWLLDPDDQKIVSTKFFTYGGPDSVAVGEALCSLAENMTFEEAVAISGKDILSFLANYNYFPINTEQVEEQVGYLVSQIKQDHPLAMAKLEMVSTELKKKAEDQKTARSASDEKWLSLSTNERIQLIESALDSEVRDALQFDGGDINIIDVKDDWDIFAEFEGNCSSCSASIGSTFMSVENVIKTKVNERLNLIINSFPW